MNIRDQLSGLVWLGISVFVCIESIRADVGSFHSPGPGFLPFWSAVILGAFAILQIVISVKKKKEGELAPLWKGFNWSKVIWVLFSLFLYTLLLPIMGYLIATFGLMAFLGGVTKRSKAWIQGLSALAIASVSYLIFYVLLDIKLPKGIFGF
jgi:putative tricarboxylic transport membrane protein